jgi:hypothetical protein
MNAGCDIVESKVHRHTLEPHSSREQLHPLPCATCGVSRTQSGGAEAEQAMHGIVEGNAKWFLVLRESLFHSLATSDRRYHDIIRSWAMRHSS